MASMEKCNLDELLEALSEMDQAAIQQEKLNTKLQAELHAQTHELGRLHAELAVAPAPPEAKVAPEPPVSPGKMRCFPVWIAAIAGFCLLLVLCNFFQAALENSFEHLQKTFLQRIEAAPSPSLRLSADAKIDKVQKASSNSRVQQLSTTEGNASGDELVMITPAPSKSVKQAGTRVYEELEDKSELAQGETHGDRATPTSTEADETSRQEEKEEKQPELQRQAEVDMASASEEPSEAQGATETQTGTEADETSRQEEKEEKQPEPQKQAELDTSASEQPSAEAHGQKGARSSTEADASSSGEAPSQSKGWHEEISEIDGFIPACDKLGGLSWKKDGTCGNVTPWPDLCFLKGGSRTTPDCGLSVSEETVEPPFHWSFASLLAISEKIWEAEEIAERGLGGAIGLLAGAWCFW